MENKRIIKIIAIGDSAVGKTSILRRFSEDTFTNHHLITIGIDFITKDIKINNEIVSLKIWDTAGQERFRTITNAFYNQVEGVLLVFDITNRSSYENLHNWINDIHEYANENVIIYLIGTKIDLSDSRKVAMEEGKKMAYQYNMKYFEVSAKTNTNITEPIEGFAKDIFENIEPVPESIKVTGKATKKDLCLR